MMKKALLLLLFLVSNHIIWGQCTVVSFDPIVISQVSCPGEADGSATVTDVTIPFGGTQTYVWSSPGQADRYGVTAVGLTAGVYTVVMTNSLGCSDSGTVTITEEPAPTIAHTTTDASCYNMNDGSATLNVTGTAAPYVFNWGSGIDSSALYGGMYSVVITDANSCVFYDTLSIYEPGEILDTVQWQAISCFAANDGSINTVLANPGNYTYNWSNGATTPHLSSLMPGTYSIDVTDTATNCVESISNIEIVEPAVLQATAAVQNVSCAGFKDASVQLTINGGTLPYTVDWGGYNPDSLYAGTYVYSITDARGCQIVDSVTVTEPSPLSINLVLTDVSCHAGNNGTATSFISGGTTPYALDWNGADTSALVAGNYTLSITDANACHLDSSFEITEPSAPLAWSSTTQQLSCHGLSDGFFMVDSIFGGTAPYTSNWNGVDTAALGSGIYPIEITDAQGCLLQDTIHIIDVDSMYYQLTTQDEYCVGDSTGSALLTIIGGLSPYQVDWFGQDPSKLTAGTFVFSITDSLGCQILDSVTISSLPPLQAQLSVDSVSCYGLSDGSVSVTLAGAAPFQLNWGGIDTTALAAGQYQLVVTDVNSCQYNYYFSILQPDSLYWDISTQDVSCYGLTDGLIQIDTTVGGIMPYTIDWNGVTPTVLSAGNYQLSLTDANGCVLNDSVQISQPDSLFYSATIVGESCANDSTGSIQLSFVGGVTPYQIDWQGVNPLQLTAGQYHFVMTDANNCMLSDSLTVVSPLAMHTQISQQPISCYNMNDGLVSAAVTGGTMPYTLDWGGIDTTAVWPGSYQLYVTDSMGCEDSVAFDFVNPDSLTASHTVQHISCYGLNDGQINVNAVGGTTPYTFDWSGADPQLLSPGTYAYILTDDHGCSLTDSAQITEPDSLSLTALVTDAICFGAADGQFSLDIVGGTQPYTVDWNGVDTAAVAAGNYSIMVTDANGCAKNYDFEVADGDEIVLEIHKVEPKCFGGDDGKFFVQVSGGLPNYQFLWSNGESSHHIINLSAGVYDLLVTDALGCEKYQEVTLSQPEELTYSVSISKESCTGQGDGRIDLEATGGTAPLSINWSNGAESDQLTQLMSGVYHFEITDDHQCVVNDSVVMTGEKECYLLPTFFTPNGDGYNDSWYVRGLEVEGFELKVYNRRGVLLFETTDVNQAWDGQYQSEDLPTGDYYYWISWNGQYEVLQGVVTLKR
jgi:gliding motility-associated-like protein